MAPMLPGIAGVGVKVSLIIQTQGKNMVMVGAMTMATVEEMIEI